MTTTTTEIAADTDLILAIDPGKYKNVACAHDDASGEIAFTILGDVEQLP